MSTSYSAVQRRVVGRQRERFGDAVKSFARGTKFRPSGRAPYLHILKWLAESESWSIHIPEEIRRHPSEKASVGVAISYLSGSGQGLPQDLLPQPFWQTGEQSG